MTEKKSKRTNTEIKNTSMRGIVKKLETNISYIDNDQIILSDGLRTSCQSICSIPRGCPDNSRKRIRKSKRRLLATYYDIFVPIKTRACGMHINYDGYPNKNKNERKYLHNNFTVSLFEAYVDNLKQGPALIDFEDVEAMADHVCKYWTGITVIEFIKMFESLKQPKLMKSALAVYLIRKITGDSVRKLAKVLNINSEKLKKQIRLVKKHFEEIDKSNSE